ncbi:hypothetical protein Bxe_B0048 [Paraburkholderia xenovorans LB400]|uniref:Uncharacterized protein n=1 Tax=Paraburkholderia xenovorans (strain LB400) TaxID=266265 RepID=Q13J61_PARXL|nr:hypothetical protein Bxe_B0048 [Paraburkholderia xenovorans LB400]
MTSLATCAGQATLLGRIGIAAEFDRCALDHAKGRVWKNVRRRLFIKQRMRRIKPGRASPAITIVVARGVWRGVLRFPSGWRQSGQTGNPDGRSHATALTRHQVGRPLLSPESHTLKLPDQMSSRLARQHGDRQASRSRVARYGSQSRLSSPVHARDHLSWTLTECKH